MAGDTTDVRVESPGGTAVAAPDHAASNGAHGRNGVVKGLIDLDFVRGLIDAVDESGIDSIEIHRAGTRIRISKTPPPAALAPAAAVAPANPAPVAASSLVTPPATPSDAASGEQAGPAEESKPDPNLTDVKSPMVGTFYRAPAPEAPPYVEVGATVSQGQTLCILEAMKLMNELESEYDGIVREILVENADPVEYGEVLFRIERTDASA